MALSIKLEVFEGPLDLLLHLIDKHKIDIYDIPIAIITDQYLKHIQLMEDNQMEVMSEFIEMAAILISIKTKMLLPRYEEEEEEEDPREALVQKLIEYRKYKMISETLKDKHELADKSIFKEPSIPKEVADFVQIPEVEELLQGIEFGALYQVFQNVLKRNEAKVDVVRSKFGEIKREEYSVQDKIQYIRGLRASYASFSFEDLLEEAMGRVEIIVTFLAVLELMKMGEVRVAQSEVFDEIIVRFWDK